MGKISNGAKYGDGFNIGAKSPIDSRMRVEYLNDLTTSTTWIGTPAYQGMVVTVMYEGTSGKKPLGDVYILKDEDATKTSSWKKIGGSNEILVTDSLDNMDTLATKENIGKHILLEKTSYDEKTYESLHLIVAENVVIKIYDFTLTIDCGEY